MNGRGAHLISPPGRLWKPGDFTRRSGRKPSTAEIIAALTKVGHQHLLLSKTDQTIQFGKPGMSINLGAIGKGEALDRVADQLRQHGIGDFLIHGGNSSVIAAGDQYPRNDQDRDPRNDQDRDPRYDQDRQLPRGWQVGIAHPTKPQRRLGGIWLRDGALATSGSGKQFFHHRGQRYGHVIDPRTGYPAGDLLSLTVTMESAADADACATGLFVMGSEGMEEVVDQDWFPPWIAVKQAARQDEVELSSRGPISWVEA